MTRLKTTLTALGLAGAVIAAPTALADSYHYYYNGPGYDRHHPSQWRGHHRQPPQQVIHHHHVYHHEPVRERVVVRDTYPRYDHRHRRSDYRSATPMIMGGIVGGVLGNQVGKGRGRDVATVAGVLLGGSIGRDLGYRR